MTRVQVPAGTVVGFLLFATTSRPALELTQPLNLWVVEDLSPGAKWPDRESDHSLPPSVEFRNS